MRPRPKILALDIETAPHTAHVWGLHGQYIAINQIMDTGRVLCFAWKWLNEPSLVNFVSERDGKEKMLKGVHELLSDADIVVTYNGKKFDLPTLNKEFLECGLPPPAPFKSVDLYRVVKSNFRFASNKLDHVAKELGLKTKIRHNGHELWVRCMEGDPKSWKKMERYNKRDVLILDKLYHRLLPWIKDHPNVTIISAVDKNGGCPRCGSTKIQSRGYATTKAYVYARYQCVTCGGWFRGSKSSKEMPVGTTVTL